MTDYHVITPEAAELVMQVIDGQVVIVPPVGPVPTPPIQPLPRLGEPALLQCSGQNQTSAESK